MNQVILMDNDALLKLACYGLFKEALVALNTQVSNVCLLAVAKYVLMPYQNRLKFCGNEATVAHLTEFIDSANRVKVDSVNSDDLDLLTGVPNIDAGEALLLAAGATEGSSLVLTGDKRSIAALYAHSSLESIAIALEGRIVCMELLVAMMVEQNFEFIQTRIRAKPKIDKALTVIFGVSIAADWASVQEGLQSYINYLVNQTGNLLYLSKR